MTNGTIQAADMPLSEPLIHVKYLEQSDWPNRPKAPHNPVQTVNIRSHDIRFTQERPASVPPDPSRSIQITSHGLMIGSSAIGLGLELGNEDQSNNTLLPRNTDEGNSASGSSLTNPEKDFSRRATDRKTSALATAASPTVAKGGLVTDNDLIVAQSQETTYQDNRRSVKVIRPSPVKTVPPIHGGLVHSPGAAYSAGRRRPEESKTDIPSSGENPSKEIGHSDSVRKKPWCEQATDSAKRDKEVRRKRNSEEVRRHQEQQCAFPENDNNNNMPPTSGKGRGDDPGSTSQSRGIYPDDYLPPPASQRAPNGGRKNGTDGGRDTHSARRNGDENPDAGEVQATPYFERLVTEEVQSLKTYARIMENQNRRLAELEKVHGDLETRLEVESRLRQHLETTLEAREHEWTRKFEQLTEDRDHWKQVVQMEQAKNARLMDQMNRKDQDIHRMLQRKYDHEAGRSTRNVRTAGLDRGDRPSGMTMSSRPQDQRTDFFRSPHEILEASGSVEKARVRNVKGLLFDFFAM